jgi:energy-coupling factor transport system substrate-specific component
MLNKKRIFTKLTIHDLLIISVMSAMGLSIKPLINPLIHLISIPLRIPGGAISGGFLMMWISLCKVIIFKFGSTTLLGLSQAIVVILLGTFGNHGAFTLVSYTFPGIFVDLTSIFIKGESLFVFCIYTTIANLTGTIIVGVFLLSLPFIPLLISILSAVVSGMLGGYLAFIIYNKIKKYKLV